MRALISRRASATSRHSYDPSQSSARVDEGDRVKSVPTLEEHTRDSRQSP